MQEVSWEVLAGSTPVGGYAQKWAEREAGLQQRCNKDLTLLFRDPSELLHSKGRWPELYPPRLASPWMWADPGKRSNLGQTLLLSKGKSDHEWLS